MGYILTKSSSNFLRLTPDEADIMAETCNKHKSNPRATSLIDDMVHSTTTLVAYCSTEGELFTTCTIMCRMKNGAIILRQGVTKRVTYGKMEDKHNPTRARSIALARACLAAPIYL